MPLADATDNLLPAAFTGLSRDALPFAFLARGLARGIPGALVSISAIDGGAPKPLGAHMAVLADGSHVGHVSGGCVEPAIAAEVVADHARGQGPRPPLRQGLALSRHPLPLRRRRRPADPRRAKRGPRGRSRSRGSNAARPSPSASIAANSSAAIVDQTEMGWHDGVFVRRYLPRTKLLLVGRGPDFEVLARVAAASEMELSLATPDETSALALADLKRPGRAAEDPGSALGPAASIPGPPPSSSSTSTSGRTPSSPAPPPQTASMSAPSAA